MPTNLARHLDPPTTRRRPTRRTGGIYIAVLATALVVSLLSVSALVGQRLQNRMVVASSDIRQAQLNAATAVELGLLKLKTDGNWRSQLDAQSYLIKNRGLASNGGSTCSLLVSDAPTDTVELADKPVRFVAVGRHGPTTGNAPRTTAEQRQELVVEPRRLAHECLKSGSTAVPDWAAVFLHYQTSGTQINVTSLPDRAKKNAATVDDRSFSRNPSVTSNDWHWFRADDVAPSASEFTSANVNRRENTLGHQACLEIERSNRKGGPANRLQVSLLKPDTQYRFDLELYPDTFLSLTVSNSYKAYLVVQTGGTTQVIHGSTASITGSLLPNWFTRTFYVTTPTWTSEPTNVYFAINCETSGGNNSDFYVDNIDAYEANARFIHQTVLGPGVNPFGAANSAGIYWIDCQNTKLVIERSRIFGTLLILNPGPGSCIDYGPIHMSPAVPGYPALLVSNAAGNAFSIRATPDPTANPADDALDEAENGVNFNPTGAPHKTLGTDSDQSDKYDSEIRGLVVVSGNLSYANNPTIRGRVLVGGTNTGTPTIEFQPDSLINPPPPLGGFYTYRYDRRAASVQKAVAP